MVRYLAAEDYRLKFPRPWPSQQDEEARALFLTHVSRLNEDPDVELWFLDDSGFDGDPRARRRLGQKRSSYKNLTHTKSYSNERNRDGLSAQRGVLRSRISIFR